MATLSPSPSRTEFFQQLKRVCVPLSRHALAPQDKPVDSKGVLSLLEELVGIWTTQAGKDASVVDDKLADYVFFPISHLLKVRDRYPIRVTETVVRLLRGLIQHGWKSKASPQLVRELLIFFSFLLGGVPGQQKKDVPEEMTIEGFRALAALISVVQPSHLLQPSDSSSSDKATSPLPYAIEVILDEITESTVAAIQLEALNALGAVLTSIKDNKVLAQFLPGIVSALTKLLAPPRANQTQRRVLLRGLELLQLALTGVLADIKVRTLLKQLNDSSQQESQTAAKTESSPPPELLSLSWLKATSAQIKIALAAVLKLRGHDAEDIHTALHKFCIALLDECHASLANCRLILVETAMMLEDQDAARSPLQTSLQDLAGIYPELGDSIKTALYSWITGLPRLMQSNDERVKQLAVRSILRGSNLAAALHMDSTTLEDALGDSLRDSIVTLVKGSKPPKIVDDVAVDMAVSTDLVKPGRELAAYSPVLLGTMSEKATREAVGTLLSRIGSATQQVKLATTMLGYVRDCDGVDQVASFWLAFELLKSAYSQSADMDEFIDMSSLGESSYRDEAFQELYDFSVSLISAHSDSAEQDWRLEAIALEVSAFAATRFKTDFRTELIDVLYPITTFLGSPVPQLRQHAITTLNVIAACCGCKSVSDLIVENADYMVNSISLRLNTFDISPASTKVLTMVIRLTGPRLLPYLDDVVSAIFAALDNYHGYPVFVESLFSVLSEVVSQGVKSDKLLLEDGSNISVIDHRKKPRTSLGIPGILDALDKRIQRAKRTAEEEVLPFEPHPKKPWGPPKSEAKSLLDKLTNPDAADTDEDEEETKSNHDASTKDLDKPKTPTYALLSKILSLTQHYLTSPAPTLRKSLLDLISTASPALAPDENAFLPLVHAVWPVLMARLYDPEPYVQVAACKALEGMCKSAGDFLGNRLKTEWEGKMGRWVRGVKAEAEKARAKGKGSGGGVGRIAAASAAGGSGGGLGEEGILIPVAGADGEKVVKRVGASSAATNLSVSLSSSLLASGGSGALGQFAQAWQVWKAVLDLLAAMVGYVRMDDEMFDDILGLVVEALPRHGELREALETVNADAVWLAMYERGMVKVEREPEAVEGWGMGFVSVKG
ncbi:hypothetical protein VTJ04DRAFT_695 [Mycothermus thermophilus]|uniref:uncharacterized protein n=1 Tax=Humicola insolens TaxID=85995 RepID=UPI0037443DB1